MGVRLIKISVVYLLIGISLGLFMSVTHVFNLSTVHVHLNLLGWVTLAIAGLFYTIFPHLAETASAKAHFWLHNIGLPVMMVSIALAIMGVHPLFFLIATLAGTVTVLGVFCFGYNVLKNLRTK